MASQSDLVNALRCLHDQGARTVQASAVVGLLWPDQQKTNVAGVAGRMLRSCVVVRQVSSDQWEILGDRLKVLELEERLEQLRQINGISSRDTLNHEFYLWDSIHHRIAAALVERDRAGFDEALRARTAVSWLRSHAEAVGLYGLVGFNSSEVLIATMTFRQVRDEHPRAAKLYEQLAELQKPVESIGDQYVAVTSESFQKQME